MMYVEHKIANRFSFLDWDKDSHAPAKHNNPPDTQSAAKPARIYSTAKITSKYMYL